jgi:hypothetical protein
LTDGDLTREGERNLLGEEEEEEEEGEEDHQRTK